MKDNTYCEDDDGPRFICRLAEDFLHHFELNDDTCPSEIMMQADSVQNDPHLLTGPRVDVYAIYEQDTGELLDVVTEIGGRPSLAEDLTADPQKQMEYVGFAFIPDADIALCYGDGPEAELDVIEDIRAELRFMFGFRAVRPQPGYAMSPG